MIDSLKQRLDEAAAVFTRLRALVEKRGDELPGLLVARAVIDLDGIGNKLAKHERALNDASGKKK